jgi:GDP-L-fucose synthase
MYGPNDNFDLKNSHVLSALIRRFHEAKIAGKNKVVLWGSGKPRREFLFSEDVADASIFAMKNARKFQNAHYNVGAKIDYSIKELAGIMSKIAGFKGEIQWDTGKPDGAARKLLDSSRFSKLGWKPSVNIIEGIKTTYEWYLKMSKFGRITG